MSAITAWIRERKDGVVAVVLFGVVAAVHAYSPITTSFDSRWSMHTAASLLLGHGGALDDYEGQLAETGDYGIERIHGHPYNRYPIAPSILAVPFLYARAVFSRHSLNQLIAGTRAARLEASVASIIVGATTALLFLVCRIRTLSIAWALAISLAFAFGTSAWSTASRALWQHGPSMLMISAALYLLLLARRREALASLLGIPIGFALMVRPTNALPVAGFILLVAWQCPRQLIPCLLLTGLVMVPFFLFYSRIYGAILPPYFSLRNQGVAGLVPTFREALAGHLLSPNRGLLIFSPVLALSLVGAVASICTGDATRLDVVLIAVLIAHWLAISNYPQWWAGHSFGPRYFTDVLPILTYFLVDYVLLVQRHGPRWRTVGTSLFVFLAAISIATHSRAALSWDVFAWNGNPVSIDDQPSRAWDWNDMQVLQGLR